jgi:SnoaL-like domain
MSITVKRRLRSASTASLRVAGATRRPFKQRSRFSLSRRESSEARISVHHRRRQRRSTSHFVVTFKLDVAFKPQSKKFTMEEVAVYKVADGKIVYEEFFYNMQQRPWGDVTEPRAC